MFKMIGSANFGPSPDNYFEIMNGPQRTAFFAKGMPNYTFSTLNSIWFSYTPAIGLWYCKQEMSGKTDSETQTIFKSSFRSGSYRAFAKQSFKPPI